MGASYTAKPATVVVPDPAAPVDWPPWWPWPWPAYPYPPYPPGVEPLTPEEIAEYCDEDCVFPDATGCLSDCSNAVASSPVDTFKGTFIRDICASPPPTWPDSSDRSDIRALGAIAGGLVDDWAALWTTYCVSYNNVLELQCELGELECLQSDTTSKEVEIAAEIIVRDAALAAAASKSSEADVAAVACTDAVEAFELPVQFYYHAHAGSEAFVDTACTSLGPTCSGRNPLRCRVSWSVRHKQDQESHCTGDTVFEGSYAEEVGGGYTPNGVPYITSIGNSSILGLQNHACASSTCIETPYFCEGDWPVAFCGNTWYTDEIELRQTYTEITGGGETCC